MCKVIFRNNSGAIAEHDFSKLFIDTDNRPYILYGGWVNNIPIINLFESEDLEECNRMRNRLFKGDKLALIDHDLS